MPALETALGPAPGPDIGGRDAVKQAERLQKRTRQLVLERRY